MILAIPAHVQVATGAYFDAVIYGSKTFIFANHHCLLIVLNSNSYVRTSCNLYVLQDTHQVHHQLVLGFPLSGISMIPGVHRRAFSAFESHGVHSPQLRLKVDGLAPIICSYYNNLSELVNPSRNSHARTSCNHLLSMASKKGA